MRHVCRLRIKLVVNRPLYRLSGARVWGCFVYWMITNRGGFVKELSLRSLKPLGGIRSPVLLSRRAGESFPGGVLPA